MMNNNCFYTMIDSVSHNLIFYWNTKKRENSDNSIATLKGAFYVADGIRNILSLQDSIKETDEYLEFVDLLKQIEQDLGITDDK